MRDLIYILHELFVSPLPSLVVFQVFGLKIVSCAHQPALAPIQSLPTVSVKSHLSNHLMSHHTYVSWLSLVPSLSNVLEYHLVLFTIVDVEDSFHWWLIY